MKIKVMGIALCLSALLAMGGCIVVNPSNGSNGDNANGSGNRAEQPQKQDSAPSQNGNMGGSAEQQGAPQQGPSADNPAQSESYIGNDAALGIALSNAGFERSQVSDIDVELENERGTVFYEVSFDTQTTEYDYVIDAFTGDILQSWTEADRHDDHHHGQNHY